MASLMRQLRSNLAEPYASNAQSLPASVQKLVQSEVV
jgi:6,7-dimethyl-8-ribityllumazine synthase